MANASPNPPGVTVPDLDMAAVTADLNARLVARLYDEKGGYYLLREVLLGQYVDIRPLSRDEALTFYCGPQQALLHVYP